MTDEAKKPKVDDDVPEGFTLDTPGGSASPASSVTSPLREPPASFSDIPGGDSGVPAGFTNVTPKNPAGGGVLLNPGGDKFGQGPGTQNNATVPTPPEEKSVTNFLLNQVPGSIINTASNLSHAVIHPIDTLSGMGNLIAGTFKASARAVGMDMPENESDQVARNFAEYAKSRWGGVDEIKNALYHDPVGMMMDFSTVLSGAGGLLRGAGAVADVAGAARAAETAGAVGRGVSKIGEVTNPLYLPSKATSWAISRLGPKALPPFDPKNATFAGEEAFDPSAGTFSDAPGGYKSPPPKAPVPPETMQDTVERLRTQWGVKPPKSSGLETPQPAAAAPPPKPAVPAPAPAGSKLAQNIRSVLQSPYGAAGAGVLSGEAIKLLTHHLLGSVGGGLVAGAAIKYLPQLLKSEAGQQMLARIGDGSNAAAVAGVARDLVPALNTLYQSQLQQQSMGQSSVLDRAKGGMVNPELARLQRERLQLPGILKMLEK